MDPQIVHFFRSNFIIDMTYACSETFEYVLSQKMFFSCKNDVWGTLAQNIGKVSEISHFLALYSNLRKLENNKTQS